MNKKTLMIIVVAVVIAAAVGGYFLLNKKEEGPDLKTEFSYYTPGENFVTNIKDSNRFIRIVVVLEVYGEDTAEQLKDHESIIRDTIITILQSKTETELRGAEGKQQLREEILTKLNEILSNNDKEVIHGVYFNDYVVS